MNCKGSITIRTNGKGHIALIESELKKLNYEIKPIILTSLIKEAKVNFEKNETEYDKNKIISFLKTIGPITLDGNIIYDNNTHHYEYKYIDSKWHISGGKKKTKPKENKLSFKVNFNSDIIAFNLNNTFKKMQLPIKAKANKKEIEIITIGDNDKH